MKICRIVVITGCLVVFLAFHVSAKVPKMMNVQVRKAQLRSAPSFLGKVVTTVSYTKQVEVVGEKGDWMNVAVPGTDAKGWIHTSALTKKTILLNAGEEDLKKAVTGDEVALAGKGFNQAVEEKFKKGNSDVNYAAVDKMETVIISQARMEQFLAAGDVFPEGGTK